jgi:hypothetical protein
VRTKCLRLEETRLQILPAEKGEIVAGLVSPNSLHSTYGTVSEGGRRQELSFDAGEGASCTPYKIPAWRYEQECEGAGGTPIKEIDP